MESIEKKKRSGSLAVIVFCCFMMTFTGLGFCSSPKQLFLKAITEAHGMERSLFSFNDTARYLAAAVMNLFFGKMVAKFRPKKTIMLGFGILVLSQILYALADHILVFYVAGALLGAGLCLMGSTMVSYVIKRRCKKNTGTILGIALSANGLGGAIAMQIISPIIESSTFGYRKAYWVVAAILAGVGLMIAILFKEDPSLSHDPGAHAKKARGQNWEGFSFAELKRKPYFYVIAVLVFLTGTVLSGINGISTAHMRDVGIDPVFVADVWSIHSLVLMGTKFLTGFIYDKKGLRFTLLLGQATAITVLAALALSANNPFGIVMASIYAILSPMALPLETLAISLIVGDLFGSKDFARILGFLTAIISLGFAVGSPLINLVFDLIGNYTPAILAGAGIMAVVCIGFHFMINTAYKEKEALLTIEASDAH